MSDTFNLTNSIWPNGIKVVGGYAKFSPLGTNKTSIPQNSPAWPKGNKLISPFVYQDDKLVGFCDTKAMFASSPLVIMPYEHIEVDFNSIKKGKVQIHAPKATVKKVTWKDSGVEDIPDVNYKFKGCSSVANVAQIEPNYNQISLWTEILSDLEDGTRLFSYSNNLASFNSDLSSLTNGDGMFYDCRNLRTFTSDLSSLTNGYCMFYMCTALTSFVTDLSSLSHSYNMFCGCSNLNTFNSDLSSLTNGDGMFYDCRNLRTFDSDLSSLTNGENMFGYCYNLNTFTSDLSSLTNGERMFCNSNITTFTSDLSSLTSGISMFQYCVGLITFTTDLSSLTNGNNMFYLCYNLTTFDSDLSSLTTGDSMFYECSKLTSFNADLSSLTNGYRIFYGCKLDTASVKNIAETINTVINSPSIHIGIGSTTPTEEENKYLTQIHEKGWKVYVNGSSEAYVPATASLDETGETMSTPIPFWAKPEPATEETAKYIDENGNFFNILGGQFIYVNDPETYGMFTCEEDAAANMRLTPYTKPQTETTNNN